MKIELVPILNLKKHGATCSLLILDDIMHILLDCGLNQKLDFKRYQGYWSKYIKKLDVILLSHPGVEYTGALPFILNKLQKENESDSKEKQDGKNYNNNMPQIFCTPPIKKFGLFNLYDAFINIVVSRSDNYDNEKFFMDIHRRFEEAQEIRFQQIKKLKFNNQRIKYKFQHEVIISCQNAGNTLGACAWTIKCNLVNIMYMVSYNHYQDLHLDGLDFKQLLKQKIDVLITDSNHNEQKEPIMVSSKENREKLKKQLKSKIENCISQQGDNEGNIILACYPNERIIEIVFLLHQIFKENGQIFDKYKVDFYRNYKQYLDQFKMYSSFMNSDAEELIQQKVDSPFLEEEVLDEQKKKIQPFLNVRKDLIPDNEDNNKIVLTTYNVLFIGPLYNYLLGQLSGNKKNHLIIIGRPEQELFEATLQIKAGFSGDLNLKKGEKDQPNLNALVDYIIKEEVEIEEGGQETVLESVMHRVGNDINSQAATMIQQKQQQDAEQKKNLTDQEIQLLLLDPTAQVMTSNTITENENKQNIQRQQISQQGESMDIEDEQLHNDPAYKQQKQLLKQMQTLQQIQTNQIQQQELLQSKDGNNQMLKEQLLLQQQIQQQQQSEQKTQLGTNHVEEDLQEAIDFKNTTQVEMLFDKKKFPRFYHNQETLTITDYGHDVEGFGQPKLQKLNIAKVIQQTEQKQEQNKGKEVGKQMFQHFVKIDMLQQEQQRKQILNFQMQVSEFPLKGISDFKSAINILTLINPKHLILVNGTQEEQQIMKKSLDMKFDPKNVLLPVPGAPVFFSIANESLDIENFDFQELNLNNNNLQIVEGQSKEAKIQQQILQQFKQNQDNDENAIFFKKVTGQVVLNFSKETEKTEISLSLTDQISGNTNEIEAQNKNKLLSQENQNLQLQQKAEQSQQQQQSLNDVSLTLKQKMPSFMENLDLFSSEENIKKQQQLEEQMFQKQQEQLKSQAQHLIQNFEDLNNLTQEKVEQEIQELEIIDLRDGNLKKEELFEKQQQQELKREFFGDFKFEKLMTFFIDNKIKCSVSRGVMLLFNGRITISKTDGFYSIEGVYSPEYFKVRKILYSYLNSQQDN